MKKKVVYQQKSPPPPHPKKGQEEITDGTKESRMKGRKISKENLSEGHRETDVCCCNYKLKGRCVNITVEQNDQN